MENVNDTITKIELATTYLILAVLVGIAAVCGWMIYSAFRSWILF